MYDKLINGMFEELLAVFKAEALAATVIVIYVYIDAMAYLSISITKERQTRKDFIEWVNKYLKADPDQSYQYNGNDVYAARCGKLHHY